MRIIFMILALWIMALGLYAEDNDRRIIIPEVDISIDDKSQMPVAAYTNQKPYEPYIELSREYDEEADTEDEEDFSQEYNQDRPSYEVIVTNYLYIEQPVIPSPPKMIETLSHFFLEYGIYHTLSVDFSYKGVFGYDTLLLDYQRHHTDGSTTNSYLMHDFWRLGLESTNIANEFFIGLTVGFANTERGLAQNPLLDSEVIRFLPIHYSVTTEITSDLSIYADVRYYYLQSLYRGYSGFFQEAHQLEIFENLKIAYSYEFGSDLFLHYNLSAINDAYFHHFEFGLKNRLMLWDEFFLVFGGNMMVYSDRGFYWYPTLTVLMSDEECYWLEAGVSGGQKNHFIADSPNESQWFIQRPMVDEYWRFFFTARYMIKKEIEAKLDSAFLLNNNLTIYRWESVRGLYTFESITNVSQWNIVLSLDWNIIDSINLNAGYAFTYLPDTPVLLIPVHRAFVEAVYSEDWLNLSVKAEWIDSFALSESERNSMELLISFSALFAINESIQVSLSLENLLNSQNPNRLNINRNGFSIHSGIKLLF